MCVCVFIISCFTLFTAVEFCVNLSQLISSCNLHPASQHRNARILYHILGRYRTEKIVDFFQTQLVYAQQAQDTTAMHTLDENGWLPLHHAIKDNAPLGSIKLLVKGNPSAIRTVDDNLAFPLHIACQFSTFKVVKYLVELDSRIPVGRLDMNNDSVLHYACRGGNLEVIKYLMGSSTSRVSDTNADNKLPFHLLIEYENEQVRESPEFNGIS